MADGGAASHPAARIGLVLGSSTGGIGRHVHSLVRGLIDRGLEVDLFCPAATEERYEFGVVGARVTALEIPGSPGPRDVGTVNAMRRALRASPVDVIHAHGLRAGLVAMLARGAAVPLVVTWHTTFVADGLRRVAHRALARAVAGAADLTLCACDELVAAATRLGARDARLSMVVAPPLPEPARNRAEVREELGLPADAPLILSVGRLHPHKRHDILIAAAARWRFLRPMPTVIIAGTGPSYRDLVAQVAVARAPVILLGHRDDISDLVHAADLAVITSDGEARQLFAQEVLAAGVALVCTAVGGIPEIVGDAATLVPPGDVDAVDVAVRSLLDDAARRAEQAAAGIVAARTWPNEADTIEDIISAYAELVSAAGRRAPRDTATDGPGKAPGVLP